VIPVSSGDWTLTAKGLAPIANQFLNSPHAEYAGSSAKVDIGDKTKYGSTFEGYTCRTAQGKLSATTYPNAGACTGAGLGYAWYITTSNGSFCYHTPGSCAALPGATWTTTYSAPAYPWAADTGGPGGVCTGVGIGSIITTVYRNGVAQKIHNVDSTANPMCTNPGDGSATSGAAGFWIRDGETSPGTPNLTDQGNCMTCHDVHWALADTNPEAEPFRRECTSCHVNAGASASGAPQIDPMRINHLSSAGTPLEHILTEPDEACETCHMPKSGGAGSSPMHLWRINTDATYTTMGAGQANLAADGTYTNAAWVDLDHACGQCHYTTGVVRTSTLPRPTWPVFTRGQLAIAARGIHGPTAGSNVPPVADGTCAWNADTWTMTLTDASTDDHNAIVRETVNWGDGSVVADDTTAPFGPFSHTYIGTGSYPITHKVIDDAGQQSIHSCSAAPTYFAISGTVTNNYTGHTGPLAGVTVSITKVSTGVVAATVVTDAAGAYSVATLKPGAYSVFAVKVGYVFPPPTVATVGPNQVVDINSPTPILRSVKPIPIKKSLPGQINVPGAN
jgi:hypothetical protein